MPKPLLIEFVSEEIPAAAQIPAAQNLARNMQKILRENSVKFDDKDISLFSTPRRIAVLFGAVDESSEARAVEIKGPKQSAPPQALEGFLKKYKLKNLDACELRDVKGQATYFYHLQEKGDKLENLLPSMVSSALSEQAWQKSMRVAWQSFTWVRPLKNILVMFGARALKGSVDLGGGETLSFAAHSLGHPRLHKGKKIKLTSAADYCKALQKHDVIACADERRRLIKEAIGVLARKESLAETIDDNLLNEVVGLVEAPSVALGTIEAEFMTLPEEVLSTAMAVHQKYFPLAKKDGKDKKAGGYFAFVADLPVSAEIIRGNERVLRARLQDAAFLLAEDRKVPLADRVADLKTMNFFHGLGTMHDKALRLQKLSALVAENFAIEEKIASQTALLLKADLLSEMVGEFPELQGIMGGYYAAAEQYDGAMCDAISTHYGTGQTAPLSQAMALIDRIDHLAGFWLIGKQPSGSKDPFALRRAALGALRIVTQAKIAIDLHALCAAGLSAYGQKYSDELCSSLVQFCRERYKIMLGDEGKAYDILDAVFDAPQNDKDKNGGGDILALGDKLRALEGFLKSEGSADATATVKRIANILKGESAFGKIDEKLLSHKAEQALWRAYGAAFDGKTYDYGEILRKLAGLRPVCDDFFDNVMVNDKDKKIRQNRMNLLKAILTEAEKIADFSRLVDR